MSKISIIMPCYNSEKTLARAIESVITQSFYNWDLIIVDDCSSDKSKQIADNYALKDKRIIVLSTEKNSGPAKTRNIGIGVAKGDYLAFIDSDDFFEPDFLSIMLETAKKFCSDVVCCQYINIYNDDKIEYATSDIIKNKLLDRHDVNKAIISNIDGIGSLCNKLIQSSIIKNNNLKINEKRVKAEDWDFIVRIFQIADRVIFIDNFLYNYCHTNSASIMSTFREHDLPLMFETIRTLKDILENNQLYPDSNFYTHHFSQFLEFVYKAARYNKKTGLKVIKQLKKSEEYNYLRNGVAISNLPITYKILYYLISISPNFAITFSRLKN